MTEGLAIVASLIVGVLGVVLGVRFAGGSRKVSVDKVSADAPPPDVVVEKVLSEEEMRQNRLQAFREKAVDDRVQEALDRLDDVL